LGCCLEISLARVRKREPMPKAEDLLGHGRLADLRGIAHHARLWGGRIHHKRTSPRVIAARMSGSRSPSSPRRPASRTA
jgi:hypothetical protein